MVWVSRKLTDGGIALDAAEQLARRAIAMAEAATEPAGSMRDAPLLDREGRRAVFLGRAYDALGWVQLKKGDARGAVESLSKSVNFTRRAASENLRSGTSRLQRRKQAMSDRRSIYTSQATIRASPYHPFAARRSRRSTRS